MDFLITTQKSFKKVLNDKSIVDADLVFCSCRLAKIGSVKLVHVYI